ncbi:MULTISPECIES: nucleotide pyrophosphatase/phosphodiesterase family protein [Rhodomicrobium]|uniref:alkaline phosphatase family protein n=1 Tax=Rhodomicrobium TaxID=1068 RepID=UPI000B4B24CA|nr:MULTISPECIES: nucleotide pyrophosphatase/phosphodiesterase family protein [Rhodomicrobium]
MHQTLVILVVGLSPELVGIHTPNIARLAARGGMRALNTVFPAVTCTVQSTLLTGVSPSGHGAVANGWYFRDLAETWLWRQSNHLIEGEKVWEAGRKRDPGFTCANMFWWYNMYSGADWGATPRPMYPADGRKLPDHYANPPELRDELNAKLGMFPLFKFWGPATDVSSSRWIADATLHVMETRKPALTLCYLPHLDYNLQRLGPDLGNARLTEDLKEVDAVTGQLIDFAARNGMRVLIVSEYGIMPVTDAVHINRALRGAGLIAIREENGTELLDAGASEAFALADHQAAHVYVRDPGRIAEVKALLEGVEGIEQVLDADGKREMGIDHPRSGELVAISAADRWFSYYYWLDDARAPDFARTVDIHRKPGYDPVELFLDPAIRNPTAAIGWRLLKRKLGMRALMDVISAKDTPLVKGSHGRLMEDRRHGPLVIGSEAGLLPEGPVEAVDFKALMLAHVFGGGG